MTHYLFLFETCAEFYLAKALDPLGSVCFFYVINITWELHILAFIVLLKYYVYLNTLHDSCAFFVCLIVPKLYLKSVNKNEIIENKNIFCIIKTWSCILLV